MPVQPRRCVALVAIALVAGVLAPVLGAATPAGAAVAAVASSSNGSSGSRSFVTLNRPAGTVAGQVMVAQLVSNDDDPGFTAPAGWTLVSDRSITNALRQAVYLKVAGSSESTLYTWKLSTSTFRRIAGGITTYSGVDLTTPIEAAGTSVNSTASTTVTAPSITTTVPGALLVHLAAINAEGTLSPPAGMTERWEATSPSSADSRDALASASDTTQAAAGATGATAATASLPGPSIGTVVALRPAGPPPPPPPPDTDPPTTTITGGPTGTVTTSSASFTFTSGDPTATFECSLDGASFAACSSPRDYTGLSNGPHTFAVRAVDPSNNVDATPDTRTWTVNAPPPTDAVLVGAGDIAGCGQTGDTATANLLAGIAGTVFTAGDNVYNDGSATQFTNCYQPTWGQFKSRTLPTPGNHDYMTPNAAGYFGYFGAAAGPSGRGYYDTTVGAWHVISLNSNCSFVGGCGAGSPQEQWLRGVLQASSAPCTVAIMHHARFNSGANHGSDPEVQPLWQALYDNGADVVVNGHEHVYERFGPQTPSGQADAVFGLRQFTVGTGGNGHYSFATPLPNSEVRNATTFGVLKLTLHADSYDWNFVPQAGQTFTDSGTTACHGAPGTPPPPPPPPPPTDGPIAPVASTSSGSSTSRSSITLNRPAGTTGGEVMVAQIVENDDDPGFTAPAGWTLVSDRSITNVLRQAVYRKVAGSSEPSSYTWTLSDFRRVAGGITTYSGVDTTNPINASGTSVNTTAAASVTAPSITTTVTGTMLVQLAALNAEGTLTAPPGMTERWEAASPKSADTRDALASASDAVQAAAGATGARTAGATRSGASIGTLLALRPAAPSGPPDTTDPTTTIDSGPADPSSDSSATFTFSSNEAGSTFECSLDGSAAAACTSPKTYTGLSNAAHTFTVAAIDPSGNRDETPASRTWTVDAPPAADAVMVGAGDIASCSSTGDEATAPLVAGIAGTVFTAGDNVYENGTLAEYQNCYNPTWGQFKNRTLPVAGNHEYQTTGAAGYYSYFGAAAGDPSKGYYDTTVGAWHVIVLNSNCGAVGGCGTGSPQEQWLRSVLQNSSAPCTVALWHHPRWTSGSTNSNPATAAFWQDLYDFGADVVLNGHQHAYERFAPQSPAGVADPTSGIRQFTVGMGGINHASVSNPRPTSEIRNNDTFGVLKLTLHANSYDWQFVPQAGKTFADSGTGTCHGAPA